MRATAIFLIMAGLIFLAHMKGETGCAVIKKYTSYQLFDLFNTENRFGAVQSFV